MKGASKKRRKIFCNITIYQEEQKQLFEMQLLGVKSSMALVSNGTTSLGSKLPQITEFLLKDNKLYTSM